jgi:hypothetical protein
LSRIRADPIERVGRTGAQVDVLADQSPQQSGHASDDRIEVDHLRLQELLAAEREQLSRERPGAVSRFANLLDVAAQRLVVGHLGDRELGVAYDRHQVVAEVVGDAACEAPDRFKFVLLDQLGGTFDTESSGQGTTVRAEVPLSPDAP